MMITEMWRILLLTDGDPNDTSNGGNLTILGILQSLCSHGHEVTLINTSKFMSQIQVYKWDESKLQKQSEEPISARSSRNKISDFVGSFPGLSFRSEVDRLNTEGQFDAVFSYHWNGASAIPKGLNLPIFCFLGDPLDIPYSFQVHGNKSISAKLRIYFVQSILRFQMQRFIPKNAVIGVFSFGHTKYYSKILKRKCNYVRTPIQSKLISTYTRSDRLSNSNSITLVHLGVPTGTVTRNSLNWLDKVIFPIVESDSVLSSIRWLFIGQNFSDYQYQFPQIFSSTKVSFVDHIQDLGELDTLRSVLVVPSDIKLGIRTRILTAFQLGMPVLSHSSSEFGIPELRDLHNYYSFTNPDQFIEKLRLIIADPELRAVISEGARSDVSEQFSLRNFYHSIFRMS